MPNYTYRCPEHGDFDKRTRMVDRHKPVTCACGTPAPRLEVYSTPFKMEGQSMPPRDDEHSNDIYDEMGKEMQKRGYGVGDGEATSEIREHNLKGTPMKRAI
jgi:putative FmdB family regulatory protein